jgi:hypothetical protein
VNAQAKIALPPLEFDEFNALDVLVNGEIAELAYLSRVAADEAAQLAGKRALLARLRAVRTKIDAARPQGYADAIRAARAESVCDT